MLCFVSPGLWPPPLPTQNIHSPSFLAAGGRKKAHLGGLFRWGVRRLLLAQHPSDQSLGFGFADLWVSWHRDCTPSA